jgi:large subunit ribosomal protein L25
MKLKLKAKKREILGKKVSNIRKQGGIPAVIYGHSFESIPLEVTLQEFRTILKEAGETTIIDLEIEKGKTEPVLIHDIVKDPVTDNILHIDFYRIRAGEAMTVEVPLLFEGTSHAVKDLGGTFITTIKSVKIKALPKDLPYEIKVDISVLETFDDHIAVGDLARLEGVEYLADEKDVIASVIAPRTKEEMDSLSEEVAEDIESVEGVADKQEDETDKKDGDDSEDKPKKDEN